MAVPAERLGVCGKRLGLKRVPGCPLASGQACLLKAWMKGDAHSPSDVHRLAARLVACHIRRLPSRRASHGVRLACLLLAWQGQCGQFPKGDLP